METIQYTPRGVCSRHMEIDVEGGVIQGVRIMGGCVCVEVLHPDDLRGYQQFAYQRGVFSRPFLNCMYAMVPYVIPEEALIQVLDTMKAWFAGRG